jgi:ankyrin repeat protein
MTLVMPALSFAAASKQSPYVPTVRRILVHAVEKQETEVVRFLANNHYPLNGVDELTGFQPLVLALWRNLTPISTLLLDSGADVNVADKFGITPLHGAAKNHNVTMIERLLQKGAKVMVKDRNGVTPCRVALESGAQAVFDRLKQHVNENASMAELKAFEEKSFREFMKSSSMSANEQQARMVEYMQHFQKAEEAEGAAPKSRSRTPPR